MIKDFVLARGAEKNVLIKLIPQNILISTK